MVIFSSLQISPLNLTLSLKIFDFKIWQPWIPSKTLSGIEPNILRLIADYFEVEAQFEIDMLDQLAYIDGEIGDGPVGKVIGNSKIITSVATD